MGQQRGYTVVEVAIVVAIAAALLCSGGAFWMGQQGGALRSSVQLFDGVVRQARAVAATSGNGATVVFAARAGSGTTLYVYAGRPNAPESMAAQGPPVEIAASASEAALGDVPFSIFLNGAGHAAGLGGYPDLRSGTPAFAPVAAEPSCPPSGSYGVRLSVGPHSESRSLACSLTVLGSPDPVATPPPAPTPSP